MWAISWEITAFCCHSSKHSLTKMNLRRKILNQKPFIWFGVFINFTLMLRYVAICRWLDEPARLRKLLLWAGCCRPWYCLYFLRLFISLASKKAASIILSSFSLPVSDKSRSFNVNSSFLRSFFSSLGVFIFSMSVGWSLLVK